MPNDVGDLTLDKCPVCGSLHNTTVGGAACDACEENTLAEQDAFGDPVDTEDEACWCGEEDPLYDEDGLDDCCGGSGVLYCYCGGDFCVCHWHGEVECPGCDDCDDEVAFADGEFDDLDADMVGEDCDDAGEG